jgi:hypothetical protein
MDVARVVLDSFVKKLADVSKVERAPKMEGRRLGLLLLSTAPPKPHDHKPEKATDHEKATEPKHEKATDHDDAAEVKAPARMSEATPSEAPPAPSADGTPPAPVKTN